MKVVARFSPLQLGGVEQEGGLTCRPYGFEPSECLTRFLLSFPLSQFLQHRWNPL